jgi:hypothetical protein
MASLDIRPHSHRLSALAVVGLSVLAAGAFAVGMTRQLAPQTAPFPPPQEASLQIQLAGGPPEAVAAPAEPAPLLQRASRRPVDDRADSASAPAIAADAAATAADSAPAHDLPEAAPEPPPTPPEPPTADPPTP